MPDPIHPKADKIIKITCAELKGEQSYNEDLEEPKQGGGRSHRTTRKLRRG